MSDNPLTRFDAFCEAHDLDEQRRIIDSVPDDDPAKPAFLTMLATTLRSRMVDGRDIDQAISSCRLALRLSKDVLPLFRLALGELGRSTMARFERFGTAADLADLEEAMACHRRVLELTPDDDPDLLQHVREYAACFVSLLEVRDDIDTLREACTWSRCAVELLTDAHEEKPKLLYVLGGLLTACLVRHQGSVDDIHEAIVVLVCAAQLTPCADSARSAYLDSLETALSRRFEMQDVDDLGPLAQYASAVDLLPQERALAFLALLALSFRVRFEQNVDNDDYEQATIDIDMAIELQRQILEQTAYNGLPSVEKSTIDLLVPLRPYYVDLLASALLLRFACSDKGSNLSRYSSTLYLIPEDHSQKPLLLIELAESFRARFERTRKHDDFVGSVTAARHALRLKPDMLGALRCLGCALVGRLVFNARTVSATDFDEPILLLQQAADILLDSNEFDEHVMLALTTALSMRFQRLGDVALSDIEHAIALLRDVTAQLSDASHDDAPTYMGQLANMLRERFFRYRKTRDIDEAIQTMDQALERLPGSRSRTRTRFLSDLGTMLRDRFAHLGYDEDSVRAVEAHREAVSGKYSEPSHVHLLALTLIQRAMQHDGPASGFDEPIELIRGILKRDPQDHVLGRQHHLAELGHALIMRFQYGGVLDDLNKAIEVSELACSLAKSSGNKFALFLAFGSLSLCLFTLFRFSRHTPDLERGICLLRDAFDNHPSWAWTTDMLKTWVRELILRLRVYRPPQADHLREARDQARRAVAAGGGPSMVLEAALQFASLVEWTSLLPDDERQLLLKDVTAMYERVIHLIPQVAWLGDDIDRRFQHLSGYSERNIVGAAVAHTLGMKDVTRALEWFEEGRAVVWTQINGLRTPVDDLRTLFPDLADSLERTAQALENAGRPNVSYHGLDPGRPSGASAVAAARHEEAVLRATLFEVSSAFESDGLVSRTRHQNKVDEHRRLAEDYRELLDEIRGLPGFKNFLLPRSRDDLSLAAAHGPVACINMHSSRCDALILCDSDLHHVPLPDLTPEIADEWQQTMYECLGLDCARDRKSKPVRTASNDGVVGVLKRMWVVVVQPIFAALGWTDGCSIKDRRIRWCTRSSLAFLPLHAAGLYDGSSLNASDIAVSSYTSTLAALLPEARGNGPNVPAQPSILILAQPEAPGGGPLPGTIQEFNYVQQHFSATSSTFLLGPQGTSAAVLENMSKHPYIHLACHGRQGVADPMSSSFLLADGDLTLHTLMEKSLRTGELAFLSACETSKGHEKMPDEAVHLAAGMLAVGYRSVVGTMWSISDSAAPLVANEFYKALLDPKLPTVDGRPDFAYALHVATGVLRDAIVKEQLAKEKIDDVAFAKWVPFVHFGL